MIHWLIMRLTCPHTILTLKWRGRATERYHCAKCGGNWLKLRRDLFD